MGLTEYDDAVEDAGQAPENPYDAIVGRRLGREETRVRVGLERARETSPEQASETQRIADYFRTPPILVEKHRDAFKRRYDADRAAGLVEQAPALRSWLTDPAHAALASDDLEPLSTIDRLLQIGGNVGRAGAAGLVRFGQGLYGVAQAVSDAAGMDESAADAARKGQYLEDLAARVRGPQTGAGFVERAIYGGIESVGSMAPSLLAGVYGGAARLLTLVGLQTGGETYAQAREQGASVGRSALAGGLQGAIEVATEFIPAKRLIGDLAKHSGLLTTLAHQIAAEIPGEQLATVFQDLNEWALLPANKDRTFADYLSERPSAAAATAISTITAVGATTAAAHGTARLIERLGEVTPESKTIQRTPQAAEAYLAQAVKDGPAETLYAPVESWTTYWQSKGLDPAVVAQRLTGRADAYPLALATGADLAIPLARYAVDIAPTEHNAFFVNELRLAPRSMNAREAEAFVQSLEQAEVSHVAPGDGALPASPVRERVQAELLAAGFERSTAEAYATLYERTFEAIARRANVDPVQLFERYGLRVTRPDLSPATAARPLGSDAAPASEGVVAAAPAASVDTPGRESETVPDDSAVRTTGARARGEGVPARRGVPAGQPRAYPDARTREHFEGVLADLTDRARALDPLVTPDDLRPEFEARLVLWDDMQQAVRDAGRDPKDLLRAIAKLGGLGPESAGGLTGELRTLKEGTKFGALAGVQRVFRAKRTLDERGQIVSGLSFDEMVTALRQDARFAWLENTDMLIEAIDDAIRHPTSDALPTTKELAKALGFRPDVAWWRQPLPEPSETDETDDGDVSFDVASFNQQAKQAGEQARTLFDTLETGEEQARLPGDVGDVREQDVETPEFELPFQLTAPEAAPVRAKRGEPAMSPQYAAALEASRVASKRFTEATRAYRAREIDDATYLAAREAHAAAQVAFDAAFELEQKRSSRTTLFQPASDERVGLGPVTGNALADEGDVQAVALETQIDRARRDAELVGNLFQGVALSAERGGVLSGESLTAVIAQVRAVARVDPEIFGTIVRTVPVDVVDNLFGSERAAEDALRNDPMFEDGSAFDAGLSIPLAVDAESPIVLLLSEAARQVTERAGVAARAAGDAQDLGATVGAGEGDQATVLRQGERAAITFGPNRQFTIELFENADLSSFLHESAHFFFEVMRDLADTPAVARDLEALGDWFQQETGTREIGVEQHELFARGFERYLMEGQAPSVELRTIFARFRAWLLGVYRTLKGLNVDLTDEVRGVFDRLVATDTEIAQAEAEGSVAPLFTDAAIAGMTPDQFNQYRETVAQASQQARDTLQRKLLRELQREQSAWWNAERDQVRAVVADELAQQPVYRALAAMQTGTHPDGTPLGDGEPQPMKLAKAGLGDRYTPAEMSTLRRRRLYTVQDTGVSPDMVAELFGFSSGDALVRAVLEASPYRAAVERETDARMVAKYGDIQKDGRLAEAAEAAVFSHRETVIRAELTALTQGIAAGVIPPADVVTQAAQARIANTRLRDLQPGVHLMAAQRASRKAFDLVATATDRVGAVQAKQQELFALALYREAMAAKDVEARRLAWVKRQKTQAARARLGKAGGGYQEAVDGLLEQYEFVPVSNRALDRRTSLAAFIAAQEDQGLPIDLPAAVVNEARRVNYRELTVDEFVGVTDAMRSIVHLAGLKNRLLTSKRKQALDAALDELSTSIYAKNEKRPIPLEFLPADERVRRVARGFASHTKIATLARELDGYQDGGAMWEYIIRPLNEAGTREAAMHVEATKRLHALLTEAYGGKELGRFHDKTLIPAIQNSLSKEARLVVALNWGNEGNRQRVRDGQGWSDAQVQAILDTLDARDWRFVQGVWDFLESYWPDVAAKQRRVTGLVPEKVVATPIVTKYGTFTGGYYPLVYDPRKSARAGSMIDASEANLQKQAAYVQATTRRSHTEARAAVVKQPLRLELSVLYGHVEQVIHDLSHHETLIDVGRLLGSSRLQTAIYDTAGDLAFEQFKGALKDIAYGQRPATDTLEKALNFIRHGSTVAGLAWNAWTAVQQPIGVFNGMQRVGPTWVAKGMLRFLRDAATMEYTGRWIAARSDMMRLRGLTQQREINELRNTITAPGGWFDTAIRRTTFDHVTKQDLTDSYFVLIGAAQRLADIPTWLGAYEKAMASGEAEARAVALADQAVLDAQGGGQIKDLAQVQRGGPSLRLWTNFYSYGSLLYNQTREAYGKTDFRKAGSVGQFGVNLLLLYAFPAATTVALAAAFGRDDDEDSWLEAFGKELIGQALNTLALIRELGGLVKATARGYEGPAGTRPIASVVRLGQQLEQGEADRGLLRATEDVAALFFRLPINQVQRSVDGFAALYSGQTRNPLALVAGPPREAR